MKLKYTRIITIITLVILVVGFATFVFLLVIKNNIILSGFANQLYDLPLPNNTVVILKEKGVGDFGGSHPALNFWAAMEIESSLTEEELIEYYFDKVVCPANEVTFFRLKPYKNIFGEVTSDKRDAIQVKVISKKTAFRQTGTKMPYINTTEVNENIEGNLFIIQIVDSMYEL